MSIEERKDDHIDICLGRDVDSYRNWWDDVRLVHQAVPKCDLEEVDLRVSVLGRELEVPLIISAMTGGSRKAEEYNRLLARAASELGLGMGVGSQRAGLERPQYLGSYSVVKEYEIPLLLGNIGAPQLAKGSDGDEGSIQRARGSLEAVRDMIGSHAICVHLNYLQEMVQLEGETNVAGWAETVKALTGEFALIAKETGAGISRETARTLKELGFAAFDVGGLSGTSFSAVESYRDKDGSGRAKRLGTTFWDWGIPTPISVMESQIGVPIIATGGIRNGLDVARSIALGAVCGGMARRLLVPASKGYEDLMLELGSIISEIRGALFLSGVKSAEEMRGVGAVLLGQTGDYARSRLETDYIGRRI